MLQVLAQTGLGNYLELAYASRHLVLAVVVAVTIGLLLSRMMGDLK